jgi:ligand-binding sensor domain-containing protein
VDWEFPRALRYSVRALEFTDDGRLWMATDRGLAAYDGHRVRRLDARRGLLEDDLRDLAVDRYGRIWVRGREGLTIVAP